MAGDVVTQILSHETHEIVARVAHVILGLVLIPLHTHVAVDGVEALSNGAAALDVRLLDADDLEIAAPVARLVGRAAAGHAAADHKDVGIDEYGLPFREQAHQLAPSSAFLAPRTGSLSMLSASGSCASSWFLNSSWLGTS